MTAELTKVDFHGEQLDAIQDASGTVWVSLRRCCENLAVDLDTQAKKLRAKPWAVIREMPTTGSDGKTYAMLAIDLDTLPGWLFSIDARKVAGHVREKLARYQREAARVLANHFLRPQSPPAGFVPLGAVRDVVSSLLTELIAPVLSELRATATPTRAKQLPEPFTTIPDRCRYWGWESVPTKLRREIRDLAFLLCWETTGERPVITLQHSVWAGDQIPLLDRAIATVRQKYERRGRTGPRLF